MQAYGRVLGMTLNEVPLQALYTGTEGKVVHGYLAHKTPPLPRDTTFIRNTPLLGPCRQQPQEGGVSYEPGTPVVPGRTGAAGD